MRWLGATDAPAASLGLEVGGASVLVADGAGALPDGPLAHAARPMQVSTTTRRPDRRTRYSSFAVRAWIAAAVRRSIRSYGMGLSNGKRSVPFAATYGARSRSSASSPCGIG